MKITKTSPFSGKSKTIEIPMGEKEYQIAVDKWHKGAMIQEAFPMLTAGQREFIKTGITEEEWEKIFD